MHNCKHKNAARYIFTTLIPPYTKKYFRNSEPVFHVLLRAKYCLKYYTPPYLTLDDPIPFILFLSLV